MLIENPPFEEHQGTCAQCQQRLYDAHLLFCPFCGAQQGQEQQQIDGVVPTASVIAPEAEAEALGAEDGAHMPESSATAPAHPAPAPAAPAITPPPVPPQQERVPPPPPPLVTPSPVTPLQNQAQPTGQTGKSGGRWLGKAVLLIAGIAAGAYWFGAGKTVDGPDACAILLTQAQAALAQPGGASQVLVLTQNAASLCTDAPRSAQLQALQKTATAQVQQAQKQQQQAEKQAAQQRQAQAREAARQRAEQAAQQAREAAAQQAAQQAASSAAEARLLQGFLADAQQHLRQQQFDKAKAFVESAQRIAPNAPEVQRLKRQIQTQEMQYLRQNTTIQ